MGLLCFMEGLGECARIYPFARLKEEWIEKKYREFICEDFHFAYQIYMYEDGTEVVRVHDACHSFPSLMYSGLYWVMRMRLCSIFCFPMKISEPGAAPWDLRLSFRKRAISLF